MDNTPRIALLIDADNVSVDVLRQILHKLDMSGARLQHRRAYGSVQKAAEFAECCRDHAIRFLPSTFAGPNATDIAMAIDAVELMLRQPVDEVVIVSSDMDYSPLIVRLRELGCRVTGYGQQGKSGRDIERDYERVYDRFEVVALTKAQAVVRPSRPSNLIEAKRAVTELVAAKVAPSLLAQAPVAPPLKASSLPALAAKSVPKPSPKPRRPAAKKAPTTKAVSRILPPAVDAVLDACPDLRGGAPVRLNGVAVALRERGLLTKSGKTTSFFKKLEAHFALLPVDKPESVRFLGA